MTVPMCWECGALFPSGTRPDDHICMEGGRESWAEYNRRENEKSLRASAEAQGWEYEAYLEHLRNLP